ncbi:MAG TPA: hypothetical protein ENN35_00390 [Deltaproteobacteria bacterium]|nr:hypothetical protein [Deltaproteobacteria bacterium]
MDESTTPVNLNIYMNDADDAVAPTTAGQFDGLSLTSAVGWNITAAWSEGSQYNSPDISSIVKDVIGRSGWSSGNALMVVIRNNGSTSTNRRTPCTFDYLSGARKAELHITCDAGGDIVVSGAIFSTNGNLNGNIHVDLQVPAMAGHGTLLIFFGRSVSCDPLSSVSSLDGAMAITLNVPVPASESALKGNPEFQLLMPVLAGTGVLSLSDIFIGRYVEIPALSSTGGMDGDLALHITIPAAAGRGGLLAAPRVRLVLDPVGAVAALAMASINKFNIENAEISYTFVLTGGNDGTTDVAIPISSFQARLRSGDPTYLSVVAPGTDSAAAISARPNGEMIVSMNYCSGGILLQREEIIRADLEDINISRGTRSRSIVLTGHRTATTGGRTVTLRNPTSRNLYRGKYTYRCATPDIFLRPGDTVICGGDTFDVDLITYVVSVAQQFMEVTGT